MSGEGILGYQWLANGEAALEAMLRAVGEARDSVRLEMYIFRNDSVGRRFREQLTLAVGRGVRARLLLDGFGSMELPSDYWDEFRGKGGEIRYFNPLSSGRIAVRDHRKLLVCDSATALVGGFNVGEEYFGDGVARGWRDLGLRVGEILARQLGAAFDEMFQGAGFVHGRMPQFRRAKRERSVSTPAGTLFLLAPGLHRSRLEAALALDLQPGRSVQIISAYFLPSMRLRRSLMKIARRGGRVQLILAGKTDVPLARLAANSIYQSLLDAGVEIYEYQPQILHAKLIRIDDVAYAGSLNLDTRGLRINYELMIRMVNPVMAAAARDMFKEALTHTTQVRLENWSRGRGVFCRLQEKWAHFLLTRVDPFLAVARHS